MRKIGLETCLEQMPKIKLDRILDIGAGPGYKSKILADYFSCKEIWIIEGFSDNNNKKNENAIKVKYNHSADDFLYYQTENRLRAHYAAFMQDYDYHLVDADNINIPDDIKFDFIMSAQSCGHHYPISTYAELIKKHSTPTTLNLFDIRLDKFKRPVVDSSFMIKKKYNQIKWKCIQAEITIN